MRLPALLPAFVVVGALAACGDVPMPFRPDNPADTPTLARPPLASTVAVAARGLPAELDTQAQSLAEALAEALRTRDIAATTRPQTRSDLQLTLRATVAEPQSQLALELADAEGKTVGEAPPPVGVPHAELVSTDPAVHAGLAARLAQAIAPTIVAADQTRRNTVVQTTVGPGSGGARVAVLGVAGAPGDGNGALTRQITDALRRKGVVVAEQPEGAHFLLRGEVRVGPPAGGAQPVEIAWSMARGDGPAAGAVTQTNAVPPGSLDGRWGDVAYVVAEAAVEGLVQVIQRVQAEVPDWNRRVLVAGTAPAGGASAAAGAEAAGGSAAGGGPMGLAGIRPAPVPLPQVGSRGALPTGTAVTAIPSLERSTPGLPLARGGETGPPTIETPETLVPTRVIQIAPGGATPGGLPIMAAPQAPVAAAPLPGTVVPDMFGPVPGAFGPVPQRSGRAPTALPWPGETVAPAAPVAPAVGAPAIAAPAAPAAAPATPPGVAASAPPAATLPRAALIPPETSPPAPALPPNLVPALLPQTAPPPSEPAAPLPRRSTRPASARPPEAPPAPVPPPAASPWSTASPVFAPARRAPPPAATAAPTPAPAPVLAPAPAPAPAPQDLPAAGAADPRRAAPPSPAPAPVVPPVPVPRPVTTSPGAPVAAPAPGPRGPVAASAISGAALATIPLPRLDLAETRVPLR